MANKCDFCLMGYISFTNIISLILLYILKYGVLFVKHAISTFKNSLCNWAFTTPMECQVLKLSGWQKYEILYPALVNTKIIQYIFIIFFQKNLRYKRAKLKFVFSPGLDAHCGQLLEKGKVYLLTGIFMFFFYLLI